MKELKTELRMFLAEKFIYWAICLSPRVIDLFIKEQNKEIQGLVNDAEKYIKEKNL